MRCVHCLYESDHPFKFCPECGLPAEKRTEQATEPAQPDMNADSPLPDDQTQVIDRPGPAGPTQTAYVRNDYNPAQDGHYRRQSDQSLPAAGASDVNHQTPSTTGTIVMSIINMLCCGFGISMILGLIALIFAVMATSENNVNEAFKKIGWSKKLNITGLIFVGLQIIVIIGLIIAAVLVRQTPGSYADFPLG